MWAHGSPASPIHARAEFCKQQLWPILHYLVPLSPTSLGRFDPNLWSAYVRANMAFANKLVEVRHRVLALPAIACTAVSWVHAGASSGCSWPPARQCSVHHARQVVVEMCRLLRMHALVLCLERDAAPMRV